MVWDMWKKGFDAWEASTAQLLEAWMKSPLVLEPSGALLTATMKMKAASDRATARFWSSMGLPTRADQERALHALHMLESRLYDLEEKLAEREQGA